ncbi:PREDICTED: uncharacterized protein LOC105575861 [Cercocebus atys]|uniref:uncharacterized protein LOC105575861 n=1 Tax=Cercocebus atys TaxID=9531 RepID=UPI0005F5801F|nr:PREDICTED: uncharacterized protein LOC105575861 [Cercocebus atys]
MTRPRLAGAIGLARLHEYAKQGRAAVSRPWPVRPLSSRLSAGGRTLTRRGLGSGAARVGHLYNDSLHRGFLTRRPPAEVQQLQRAEHLFLSAWPSAMEAIKRPVVKATEHVSMAGAELHFRIWVRGEMLLPWSWQVVWQTSRVPATSHGDYTGTQAFYHAGGLLPLFPPQLASPPSTHFQSAWAQERLGSAAVESVISGGRGSRFRKPWLCCFNFRGDLGQGA